MADTDPATIARRLTPAQRRALRDLEPPGLRSLRPYHNLHADIVFCDDEGENEEFDGRDLDALHRLGLVDVEAAREPYVINGEHVEIGQMEADHRWQVSAFGLRVRAELEKEAGR